MLYTTLPTKEEVEKELQEKLKDLQIFCSNHNLPCFALIGSYASETGLPVFHQVIQEAPKDDFDFGLGLQELYHGAQHLFAAQKINNLGIDFNTASKIGAELQGTHAAEITRSDLNAGRAAVEIVMRNYASVARDSVNQRAGLQSVAEAAKGKA